MFKEFVAIPFAICVTLFISIGLLCWPLACMKARELRILTGNDKITCSTVFWADDALHINNLITITPTPSPEELAPFTDEDE
jgi:hypothetical protein